MELGLIYWALVPRLYYEEGCQRRISPGDVSRQHIPANPRDSPFHSQENNGVPKRGKFHTMDLGTDGRVPLFPLKTKEQRYLKKTRSSKHKGQFPLGLPPSSLLSEATPFLCSKVSTCRQAKGSKWNKVFSTLLYLGQKQTSTGKCYSKFSLGFCIMHEHVQITRPNSLDTRTKSVHFPWLAEMNWHNIFNYCY